MSELPSDEISLVHKNPTGARLTPAFLPTAPEEREPVSARHGSDAWDPLGGEEALSCALLLQGRLRVAVLARSLDEMVRRHEALRGSFITPEGEVFRVAGPCPNPGMSMVDLARLPERRQEDARRQVEKIGGRFDQDGGPLVRAVLLRIHAAQHILLLSVDRRVADEGAMEVLSSELAALYMALSAGLPSPLAPLDLRFADEARRRRERWRKEVFESQLDYWRSRLARAPAALYLPADRPRPPEITRRTGVCSARLSAGLMSLVRDRASVEGATSFVFFLAVFKVLLYRYTAQRSINVGTLGAPREGRQPETAIGRFAQPLVLHTTLPSDPRFGELLGQVRDVVLEAYEHQDVAFSTLLEELGPETDPSRFPWFQVMLLEQGTPMPAVSSPELEIRPLPLLETGRSRLDLTLRIGASEGCGSVARWQYNRSLFDPTTARRMLRHFHRFLAGAAGDPGQRLSELPILSDAERHQLIPEWSRTDRGRTRGLGRRESCVHELVQEFSARIPDALAVVDGGRHLSYGALARRTEALARRLRGRGVGVDSLVAVCLERCLEMVVGMLATLEAGGAYLPLEPETPADRLADILRDSGAPVMLTRQGFLARQGLRAKFPENGPRLLSVEESAPAVAEEDQEAARRPCEKNAAYVIYTSGSTGKPKGVVIPHRSLVNLVTEAARLYDVAPGDRVLQFTSCMFDPSAEEIFTCLTQGATLLLRNEEMVSTPARFLRRAGQWKVSVLGLPTAYWHEIAEHLASEGAGPAGALRLITIGGEKALRERLRDWFEAVGGRVRLFNCYGPTEGTVFATTWEPARTTAPLSEREVPIGFPISNVCIYLLTKDLQGVPAGAPGQLLIGGRGLARGYLERPGLTASSFIPCPFSMWGGQRLYQTGDLARYLPNGAIEFLGRIDHQIKIRGFRVEIGEIESVLGQLPGVEKAVVLAARSDRGGSSPEGRGSSGEVRLTAYLVFDRHRPPEISQLRADLKQRLPAYMIPSEFRVLARMPLTPSGKVDSQALQAQSPETCGGSEDLVAPRTWTERRLAQIWSELLGVEKMGIDDHFFDLGGHSLLIPRLLTRIQEAFARELPLHRAFEAPTLARMAAEIEALSHPQAGRSDSVPDLGEEAALDPSILPAGKGRRAGARPAASDASTISVREGIFLTGATGFIGAFLLRELLRQTAAEVFCLVRVDPAPGGGGGEENVDPRKEAQVRLRANLERYRLWDPAFDSRIIPVVGDLARPRLGLTEAEFRRLAEHIEAVYHCGAIVSELQPYSTLKLANVSGTQEVLRLASQAGAARLHHVSTLDVLSKAALAGAEIAREAGPPERWQALEGGYAQSKWVAEKLVTRARDRGLPAYIYRPGAISGDSRTGASSLGDFTSRYLKGCIELGVFPDEPALADLTPVDYLARALVRLSLLAEPPGGVYHLANPRPLPMRDVARFLRQRGYRLEFLPYRAWRSALLEQGKRGEEAAPERSAISESALAPFLPLFGPEPGSAIGADELRIDQRNTQAGLAGSDIVCPPVEDELLGTYLSYFRLRGFLKAPERYLR